jgi:hypothetical protein
MTSKRFAAVVAIGVFVFAGAVIGSQRLRADDDEGDDARVRQGFRIAPVPLNLHGKDRELVGLGSYIVNAQGDCNGCHSAGPQSEFTGDGNPYFLLGPKPPLFSGKIKVDPTGYLGGGNDFGEFPGPGFPHIVSRNLTPDKTGLPEGGNSFEQFRHIIRTGEDDDHLHPSCAPGTQLPNANCLPFPFNGDLLQIMPWPVYRNMSDHDLRAIYEYLSAVPCVGPASRCRF